MEEVAARVTSTRRGWLSRCVSASGDTVLWQVRRGKREYKRKGEKRLQVEEGNRGELKR